MDSNNNKSEYYCNMCDKTFRLKYKKKHLNTRSHRALSMSKIITFCVKKPDFFENEVIFKKTLENYNKKFGFYLIICECISNFTDTIILVKSEKLCKLHRGWKLEKYLITKIDSFSRPGYKISNISQIKITFITYLRNMTYEHYLKQPMHMIEWVLNKNLYKNPELIKTLRNISQPLIRKYKHIIHSEDADDILKCLKT